MSVQDGSIVPAGGTDVSVEVDAPASTSLESNSYAPDAEGLTQRRVQTGDGADDASATGGPGSEPALPDDLRPTKSTGSPGSWLGQVNALTRKNVHLLWGRKLKTLTILVLPSVFVICVAVLQHAVQVNSAADEPTAGSLAALEVGGAILSVGAILNTIIQINLICSEKQQGLTAFIRMVGMHESAYWWSNILAFSLTSAVSAALMVIVGLFTQVAPFTAGSFGVLWTLYFLFFLAQSASACFVSSFLCRPTWINLFSFLYFGFASATSFVENLYPFIIDICYMDHEGTEVLPNTWNWLTILVLPLMPWLSFARAFDEYARQTTIVGGSFTWSDLAGPGTAYPPGMFGGGPNANHPGQPQSAGFTAPSAMVSVLTLVLAVPWLTILSWWSAQVYGGETRKRFFFPFQPSYWGFGHEQHDVAVGDAIGRQKLLSKHERSVRIHKLSKSFKTVSAVKELTLTMERNRVFCVLGHNGAGKTTLLNTLTGLHDPTFGEAFVCGHSIRSEMPTIQRLMGICPQHDVLWDDLTAKQTLEFYARFKGVDSSELARYIDNAIDQFGLHDEAKRKVGTFSGGMKRRLSVAVSAMGDPLVCYLDEPSTGMDALHRRQVWNVIQELRKDRLVVLTTHSMEEADVLSDTIAIMANGTLKAAGTSLFLKNRYGRGYQLRLISSPEDSMQTEALVEKYLNGAEFLATSAGNLNVSLGRHLGPRVARFFRELETGELSQLVTEWEISNTTLEQVFLRLCGLNNNASINQGGVEDVYAQQTDPTKFKALDVVDTCNAVRWAQTSSTPKPIFSAVDDQVEVVLGQESVVLGRVPADTDEAQLADKYLGTMRKPLEAVPVRDGQGSLSILLPVNGIPGSKMCVRIPDSRVVTVEVPLDATPGSAMKFIAAPATDNGSYNADTTGAGLPQLQHRSASITCFGQTRAMVRKNWRMQAKQRKASCCQCCILIFFALFMFGLAPHPTPNPNPQIYTVVNLTLASQPSHWVDVNSTAAPPDTPTTTTGASAKAVGGSTLIMSLITTFNLPKLVHEIVNEKQQRLYHSMRLQGLRLGSYWFGFWLWSLALQASVCIPMVLAGYVLGVQVYKHLEFFEYVGILAAWARSQAGLAAFGGCFFRSSKIASILFYLLLVGSALTVTIINQLAFLNDWPALLLLFPLFSYERALALMLMGDQAPAGALAEAVSYNLASGTALLVLGVVLHLIVPNEYGLSESQVLVDWCCRKRKSNEPHMLDAPLLRREPDEMDEILDDDVATEKHDVHSQPPTESALVFKGLRLRYSLGLVEELFRCMRGLFGAEKGTTGRDYAISNLNFRIKSSEFFGLLGPNGAGKTSTINVLSGLVLQNDGEVFVEGHSTVGEMDTVHTLLGVCPQFETVWPQLTVEEHLDLFAELKGVGSTTRSGCVQAIAAAVKLDGDAFRQPASALSGGMKRRLSLGIALIADPSIVVADEPTTGASHREFVTINILSGTSFISCVVKQASTRKLVEVREPKCKLTGPSARAREPKDKLTGPCARACDEPNPEICTPYECMGTGVWDILETERAKGRAILLTTHSMEEADTLCTRIGIMVGGALRSIGTQAHLKSKHGDGYRLTCTVATESSSIDEQLLREHICPSACLVHSFSKSRVYLLPTGDTELSTAFEYLTNPSRLGTLGIQQWGLSQTTLEEAFIRIVSAHS